jgi:hypothetical protein
MTNGPLFVLGAAILAVSALMVVRTRAMIRFRSPGRVEPESIGRPKITVWRGVGAITALLALGVMYRALTGA